MKRAGKCIGKVAFDHKDKAIKCARRHYIHNRVVFGVYECPTCLDFHLTTKYCNLTEYHPVWRSQIEFTDEEKAQNKRDRRNRNRRKRRAKPFVDKSTKGVETVV